MFKLKALVVMTVAMCTTVPAYAAIDLTGVTLDIAPVESMIGIVLTAIAGIWAGKKLISLGNKS